ncbi:hypothetical protein B0O99DRAFT_602008 [Bisporella sp. PMI_857]|nr:hypothetical protein B0O99DRAFT_602008 [Bisporella sp. PMI_857]
MQGDAYYKWENRYPMLSNRMRKENLFWLYLELAGNFSIRTYLYITSFCKSKPSVLVLGTQTAAGSVKKMSSDQSVAICTSTGKGRMWFLLRTVVNKSGFHVRAPVESSTKNRGYVPIEGQDFTAFILFRSKKDWEA